MFFKIGVLKNFANSRRKVLYWRGSKNKCFSVKFLFQRCSVKKVLLKILQNSQENVCARDFFNTVAGLRPATLLKERPWHCCFPVNFAKFSRTPFLVEHLRSLFVGLQNSLLSHLDFLPTFSTIPAFFWNPIMSLYVSKWVVQFRLSSELFNLPSLPY